MMSDVTQSVVNLAQKLNYRKVKIIKKQSQSPATHNEFVLTQR